MVKQQAVIDHKHPYKRKVTHTEYPHGNKKVKKGGWSRMLEHYITENVYNLSKEDVLSKSNVSEANDKFMRGVVAQYVTAYWGGGICLILLISFIILEFNFPEEETGIGSILAMISFFLGFTFFAIYYFTMPKKERIFNREDGLITFSGFMWKPNITMPIDKVIFVSSSPSTQGLGAYMLQVVRPDNSYSLDLCFMGTTCYEDLSFILWYMDKNRPLPPGTALDPYRQQDFERRKAAGFPYPLFPSTFDTPEATPEQQGERNKIGGW